MTRCREIIDFVANYGKKTIAMMIQKYRNFYMIYCIGSGFAALMIVLNSAVNVISEVVNITYNERPAHDVSFFLMYIYALCISVFGIYCGVKISNNSPKGKKYLRCYLVPQIPLISIPGFMYFMKLGLDFTVYVVMDLGVSSILETRMNFAIGSFFSLNFNPDMVNSAVRVGVNIIPIILLASLLDAKKMLGKKKKRKPKT